MKVPVGVLLIAGCAPGWAALSRLYHDREHPSTLYVPLRAAPAADEPAAPPSSFSTP